jgi:hypothetical protein
LHPLSTRRRRGTLAPRVNLKLNPFNVTAIIVISIIGAWLLDQAAKTPLAQVPIAGDAIKFGARAT